MIRSTDHSNVAFEVLQHSTNFIFKFKKLYPNVILNASETELMQLITLYECAVKEQSLLKFFKPSLNDRFLATTSTKLTFLENTIIKPSFLISSEIELEQELLEQNIADSDISITDTNCKIDISDWIIKKDDPIKIFNAEGVEIGSFLSNRKAAQALGVSHTLISRYAKSVSGFLSPRLGIMVSVHIINVDKIDKVNHPSPKKYPNLDLNLSFTKGKICAISSDLSKIEGVF